MSWTDWMRGISLACGLRSCLIKRALPFVAAAAGLFMGGCAMLASSSDDLLGPFSVPPEYVVLPNIPHDGSRRDQLLLMKLAHLIDTKASTDAERAEILYSMGVVYDRLGLEATALSMFTNAIEHKVDYDVPYNFIGIYQASAGEYEDAIDTFAQALELNTKEYYVNFNRGIALYYSGRYRAAIEDLLVFHRKEPEDPYAMLWLFIAESRDMGLETARNRLERRYGLVSAKKLKEEWGFNLIRLYLGRLSESAFFKNTKKFRTTPGLLVEHLCEGYFYLGMLKELEGRDKLAYDYFCLAVAMHRSGFLEHRYGQLEMRLLERKHGLRRNAYNDDFKEQGIEDLFPAPEEATDADETDQNAEGGGGPGADGAKAKDEGAKGGSQSGGTPADGKDGKDAKAPSGGAYE